MKLQIASDEGAVTEYELDSDVITIGRNPDNTIQLKERNVSRTHLRLVREEGVTFVEDAGSSFGIRLNGNRVSERTRILPGDRVTLGDFVMRIAPNPGEITAEIELAGEGTQGGPIPGGVKGHLVVLNGPDEGSAYPLDRTSMMIGSADHNAIMVSGRGLSEVHAEIRWMNGEFEIEEMNGDVVVNRLLVESAILSAEDLIELGELQFSLRLPEPPDEELATTLPSTAWDPQTAPTIQGDASMVAGLNSGPSWWLIALIAVGMMGVITVLWLMPPERSMTELQAEVTGVKAQEEEEQPGPEVPEKDEAALAAEAEAAAAEAAEKSLEAMRSEAKEAMVRRQWDQAITLFQAILEKEPEDEQSKVNLAQSEMEERRKEHVGELGELVAKAEYIQGWERIRNGEVDVPEESVYFPVYEKHRADIEKGALKKLVRFGRDALGQSKYKAALRLGRDGLQIDSKNKEALAVVRDAKRELDKLKREAARKANKAKAKSKSDEPAAWQLLYEEGRQAKRNGNNTLAIAKFKESLGARNNAKANKMLGILFAVQGNKTRAVQYYKEYLKLRPDAKDAETVRTVIKKLGGNL